MAPGKQHVSDSASGVSPEFGVQPVIVQQDGVLPSLATGWAAGRRRPLPRPLTGTSA